MLRIKLDGVQGELDRLRGMQRQIPYAAMNGLNATGFDVMRGLKDAMRRAMPSVTPRTLNNIFVKKATLNSLSVRIDFDQIYAKDGLYEYMLPNIKGGQRIMKPSEQRLNQFYVPGIGARLDQYGNLKGGQVTQILSRLGRFGDVAGYNMNQTAASRKRRSGGSKSTEYFIITRPTGGLKPGVYMRTQKQGGISSTGAPRAQRGKTGAFQMGKAGSIQARGVVPILVFNKVAPKYQPRWHFFDEGQRIISQRLRPNIEAAANTEIARELAYRMRH